MININIINDYGQQIFIHQLDRERYHSKIYFAENSHEDIVWDYIVVFQNLNHDFDGLKYRKGGLIFVAGEPECMEPYSNIFFKQFDYVILPHPHRKGKNIYHTNPALNWHFGRSFSKGTFKYDYKKVKELKVQKEKNISMMCSSKTMMPGHVLRYKFYQLLSKEFEDKIDFFGAGIKLIDDKADIITPYRFHIGIENSTDNHYWTEKIADSILGFSIPIYCGAPNITEYLPKNSMVIIDIHNPRESFETIRHILADPEKEYEKRWPALLEARNLLLNKYNMFPMLEYFISENNPCLGDVETLSLFSYTETTEWKIRMLIARIKRLIFKLTH